MMKQIRVTTIIFDTEIKGFEIPAFRGAVAKKVGLKNVLFHNHLDDDTFRYKYPLIQYKSLGGKPTLQCIEHGVDEIHKFFEKKNWDLKIGDRTLEIKIYRLDMNRFTMQVWDKMFPYEIRNWIGLNQDNYSKYQDITTMSDKIVFLEKILTGNILSMAKGLEWTIDKPVQVKIKDLTGQKPVTLKSKSLLGFDLVFMTNVFLPDFIGLGKGVSLGYGMVRHVRTSREPARQKRENL